VKTHQAILEIPSAPFEQQDREQEGRRLERSGTLSKKARPSTNSYKDDALLVNTKYKKRLGNDGRIVAKEPTRRQWTRYESQQI